MGWDNKDYIPKSTTKMGYISLLPKLKKENLIGAVGS